MRTILRALSLAAILAAPLAARAGELTVYSGRAKNLVEPMITEFTKTTGIKVNVRYGSTADMASTILEEGKNCPADIYYAQDAGALGMIASEHRFRKLPKELLDRVAPRFRSPEGFWTGTSGRARVLAYNTNLLKESDLPASILDFTDPKWKGKLGWAPPNGSFQAFVTALRLKVGEEGATKWLKGVKANEPRVYPNNSAIVAAIGAGEIQAGFVNHYYLLNFLKERGDSFPVKNYYFPKGDIGSMINVAGAGIVDTTKNAADAEKFLDFVLSPAGQKHFTEYEESEYPLIKGVAVSPKLKPLDQIDTPDIDLSKLSDLKGTLKLLRDLGILE